MKKLLLIAVALFSLTVFAQTSGGPGPYGYTWVNTDHATNPAVYNWIDIEAVENYVDGLGDDNIVGPFNISPSFNYFWYSVDKIYIGSNGYIGFKPIQVSSPFPTMPTNSFSKNNFIAGFMCDLNFAPDTTTIAPGGITANPARCYFADFSTQTVISYVNVPFWTDPNTNPIQGQEWAGFNTFQIVLNKLDSTITINYKDRDITVPTNGNDIEVGIQSKVGSFGLQQSSGIYFDAFSTGGMPNAIRFDLPTNPGAITDVAVDWNDNIENKGIFLSADGADYTLKTNVLNEGNTVFNGASVISNLSPQFAPPAVSNNATLNPLNSGEDTTFVFTNKFQPLSTVLGPHTFLTMLSGATGDMDPTNNTLEQEIVVVDTTQSTINLTYAHTPGGGSINWSGGNGGIAVYFEPPFYPALIKSTNFFIESNAGASGFCAKIYDDDGPNGSAGTLIDSVCYNSFQISAPANNLVPTASPDTIFSGGVYVLWYMSGPNIALGKDVTPPISGQTYEVLSNFWATYRDVENEDFFISVDIEKLPLADDIGVTSIVNPANGSILSSSQNVEVIIENFGNNATTSFDVSYQFNSGTIVTETISNPISSGSTYNHVFSTPIGPMSIGSPSAQLCSWTSYTPDPNSVNNQSCNTINAPTTGLNEQNVSNIFIYPNPTTGKLFLENLPKENIKIIITDVRGKTIYQSDKPIGKTIDISTFTDGVYQIKIEGKDWVWNKKLIKQ
ncbi:MAG: T9SS type A sorting domain-containing protein [Flavobacteriales bacterium]|nr:T9SS type A sorting domain-containing protein [Flavobacteriales bacterium]